MKYVINVRSNVCDSYAEVMETTSLQEAINMFCKKYVDFRVIAEQVYETTTQGYYCVPALYAIDRNGESWWEYTMILWSE